jgi:glutamine cyclotransferase
VRSGNRDTIVTAAKWAHRLQRAAGYTLEAVTMHDDQPEPEPAEILREYGPYPGVAQVHGVTYDGRSIWFAAGDKIMAISPYSGEPERSIDVPAQAGTAYDGQYLYQLADNLIRKIDPTNGRVVSTIPAPVQGLAGMTWAEGSLWVGEYNARKIHQLNPETGEILRTLESNRFVTGVTWVSGELWHGTHSTQGAVGDSRSELRQIDPQSGRVLRRIALAPGASVSGLESDGGDVFYSGGGSSGKLRAVRRTRAR